jgi:hypothetical protein
VADTEEYLEPIDDVQQFPPIKSYPKEEPEPLYGPQAEYLWDEPTDEERLAEAGRETAYLVPELGAEPVAHQIMTSAAHEPMPAVGAEHVATGPAPHNLPIVELLTPLEEAQARVVKADINATATVNAALAEATLLGTAQPAGEPTQEEYKRRLNELLSGKM